MSMTHFPELTEKVHAPRALHIRFPLGRTFGQPGREDLQKRILTDMLGTARLTEPEILRRLDYKWRRD
ncbi:hypothetical protein HCN83_04335 [Bacillus luteus]|uniref:Uncharacterized protein n=2 Tax=Alkalicoccus luteus TaxID=1237094 RepID=A0A969PPX4_9BACI|nr:hypothetical protein [Alkalicoccus luteus]